MDVGSVVVVLIRPLAAAAAVTEDDSLRRSRGAAGDCDCGLSTIEDTAVVGSSADDYVADADRNGNGNGLGLAPPAWTTRACSALNAAKSSATVRH